MPIDEAFGSGNFTNEEIIRTYGYEAYMDYITSLGIERNPMTNISFDSKLNNKVQYKESIKVPEYIALYGDGLRVKVKDNNIPKDSERYNEDNYTDADNGFQPNFFFPDYSSNDYILDRNRWRKQVDNAYSGIGYFYFKIFFNFNTNYGLLGGILTRSENNQNTNPTNVNTANEYLKDISQIKMYESEMVSHRLLALQKFVKTLSYISSEAPWFFKEIGGLNNIKGAYLDDFNKEKVITIKCLEEAIDMRLGTLFDLYKYATYDNINCKEIIPANLRKFEMSIMVFNIPMKLHNTGFKNWNGKNIDETKIDVNDLGKSMSFKMYTFQNCEFDVDSMSEMSDNISNENSFSLGANQIKIKYDRVYEHRMNKIMDYMFGPDGFYFNKSNSQSERDKALLDLDQTGGWGNVKLNDIDGEKIATDLFEANFGISAGLGNIYGTYTNVRSKYYSDKTKYLKEGTVLDGNIFNYDFGPGTKYFSEKLRRDKEGTVLSGNIYNYDFGPGTGYFNTKLRKLKNSSQKTTIDSDGNILYQEEVRDSSPKSDTLKLYGSGNPIPTSLANPDSIKLDWNAEAIRNSNNMFAVDGVQSTSNTFLGKLGEASWQRIKQAFKF